MPASYGTGWAAASHPRPYLRHSAAPRGSRIGDRVGGGPDVAPHAEDRLVVAQHQPPARDHHVVRLPPPPPPPPPPRPVGSTWLLPTPSTQARRLRGRFSPGKAACRLAWRKPVGWESPRSFTGEAAVLGNRPPQFEARSRPQCNRTPGADVSQGLRPCLATRRPAAALPSGGAARIGREPRNASRPLPQDGRQAAATADGK